MENFLQDITSPHFLLTAGVFAILVNIVSTFLVRPLDKLCQLMSQSALERRRAKDRAFQKQAYDLAMNPEDFPFMAQAETRFRLFAILAMLAGLFALVIAVSLMSNQSPPRVAATAFRDFMMILSAAAYMFSMWLHGSAKRFYLLVMEARRYRSLWRENGDKSK